MIHLVNIRGRDTGVHFLRTKKEFQDEYSIYASALKSPGDGLDPVEPKAGPTSVLSLDLPLLRLQSPWCDCLVQCSPVLTAC